MTLPTLKVEVSFTEYPQLPPTWTDISAFVESATIRRGRQHELDRFEAGEASVTVRNHDRRFYPFNPQSPYYPYVTPDRRLRISAVHGGINYPLFSGYVNSWPQERQGFDDYFGEVTITDAFKVLALNLITGSFGVQRTDERINDVLDLCDWITGDAWVLDDPAYSVLGTTTRVGPVADRHITTGASFVQAADLDNESALAHLQLMQQSENGLMYIGTDGQFYFYGRNARQFSPFTEIQATFTDDDQGLWIPGIPQNLRKYPYVAGSLKLRYDDTNLYNRVVTTRPGGTDQVAEDADPGPVKFWRRVKKVDLAVTTDLELNDAAVWLLGRYHLPQMRAEEMAVDGEFMDQSSVLWPLILQRELGDRIQVEYTAMKQKLEDLVGYAEPTIGYADPTMYYRGRSPNPGLEIKLVQDSFIEAINIDVDCGSDPTWETSFAISPAVVGTYWKLDDPLLSVLGETTKLSY